MNVGKNANLPHMNVKINVESACMNVGKNVILCPIFVRINVLRTNFILSFRALCIEI